MEIPKYTIGDNKMGYQDDEDKFNNIAGYVLAAILLTFILCMLAFGIKYYIIVNNQVKEQYNGQNSTSRRP